MSRIQLEPGLNFWLSGRQYIIKQRLAVGEFQIAEAITGATSAIKQTALVQLLFRGELQFLPPTPTDKENQTINYIHTDFNQIPSSLREEAKRRYRYINRVLELNLPQRTPDSLSPVIQQLAPEINDLNPPNWLTLYRWLKSYEQAGYDVRALVPKHKNKGDWRPKLQKEVIQIIERAIQSVYLTPQRADIADVYDEVLRLLNHENQIRTVIGTELLKIPHRSTIYRTISKLEPSEVAIGRYGKRIAAQMYEGVQKGPQPHRPLERVEIDHTKLPLFVVDIENRLPIGTPWLTSAIDKYSGIILGYYLSFEPPSYLSVMQCLLHAINPKNYLYTQFTSVENSWDAYGLPEVIVVDNGKEFYSTHLEDACLQLGIVIQYSPPLMPWYKSSIERYFGALNTQLLSNTPGKSFSNFLKPCDYDPKKNAVVSFTALQEMLHIFIVDIHNQSSHPELKSPRSLVWSKAMALFPPALPPSGQELKVLIGHITSRKITRRGVEFEGLIYNSSQLARLHSTVQKETKATIKYNPTDLSSIYVLDEEIHQFLVVPALNLEYTKGLSLWQHKVIKQLAALEAEQVDIVALALAKEKIQQIVEREWNSSKKGKTRTAMARWLGIGRDGLSENDNNLCENEQASSCNNSILAQPTEIGRISDLGSAFNSSLPEDIISETPDTNDTDRKQRKKVKASEQNKQTNNSTSDWQPDLSGWDVTIGLPS